VGIHIVFVVSSVLLALSDRLSGDIKYRETQPTPDVKSDPH
jgi:hypothetical protein